MSKEFDRSYKLREVIAETLEKSCQNLRMDSEKDRGIAMCELHRSILGLLEEQK